MKFSKRGRKALDTLDAMKIARHDPMLRLLVALSDLDRDEVIY